MNFNLIGSNFKEVVLRFIAPNTMSFSVVVILLGIYSMYKLFEHLFSGELTNEDFVKVTSFLWIGIVILGITLFLGKFMIMPPDSGRYCIPVFALLIISACKDLDGKYNRNARGKILVLVLVFVTLLNPLYQMITTPDYHNYMTSRYGEITYRPFAPREEKLSFWPEKVIIHGNM